MSNNNKMSESLLICMGFHLLIFHGCAVCLLFVFLAGGKVSRDAGPVKGGKTVIAFVEDPTGYKWELITREGPIPEPIAQVNM